MACNSQNVLPPQSSLAKNCRSKVAVTLKMKLKRLREFPGYWWLFECITYHITALGCLKNKEEETNLISDHFRLVNLEQVYIYYCILGQPISSSKYLWMPAFAAWRNYHHVNANTLIGAAILFPGHPYICTYGLCYREPIIVILMESTKLNRTLAPSRCKPHT